VANEWGPLWALAGEWEGDGGVDTAFSHSQGKVLDTPYREKTTMKPFGPVDNGNQHLYGLDYKSMMWRLDEADPFHMDIGYYMWDAAAGEILKGFIVPRGIALLAGGTTTADASAFSMSAKLGDPKYTIGENAYLGAKASSIDFQLSITVNEDGTWSYEQTTNLKMVEVEGIFAHTDRNTLRKVADIG
jgi:hypothetical protein